MIVSNQSNLKVHLAATENLDQLVASVAANCKYNLMTAFPLIAAEHGIKPVVINLGKTNVETVKLVNANSIHSILDSGLFTLMFGSHKGAKDKNFITKWYESLTDFILKTGYTGSCVEVDCQKVLGVETAWEFRKKMASKIKNRIINVFHKEDGEKGLDRLIEFSNYIAISVPELRFAGQKDYVVRLANYIKNRKPNIDIHLLGCTEIKLLEKLKFCTSSDSSSWTGCVRYGTIKAGGGGGSHLPATG